MSLDAASPGRSGLAILWDVIVAPTAAFEALRERTHWLWAFGAVCVLGTIGALLQIPAGEHLVTAAFAQSVAHDPNLAGLSAEKQQQALTFAQLSQHYAWLFFPVIVMLAIAFTAFVFLIGNAAGRGRATFARLFGLAANVAIVNFGIAYLLIGVLAALRGPAAFATQRDLLGLLPSLAWFAPAGATKLAAFLASFNPFEIWSFFLIALGLKIVANVRPAAAYVVSAIVAFGGAFVAAAVAR